jgi:hypothetical protein
MNTPSLSSPNDFPFVEGRSLPYALSSFQLCRLRDQLPKGIYWIKPARRILWNKVLMIDYFINGPESPGHKELIEEYTACLPAAVRRSS